MSKKPGPSLRLSYRHFHFFPRISNSDKIETIDLSFNPIDNFLGMPPLPNLKTLLLDGTQIKSFYYFNSTPSLTSINISQTPFSYNLYCNAMLIIICGFQLVYINKNLVSNADKSIAKQYGKYIRNYLLEGLILTSLQPIVLTDPETRKRIYILNPKANNNSLTPRIERSVNKSSEIIEKSSIQDNFFLNTSFLRKKYSKKKTLKNHSNNHSNEIKSSTPQPQKKNFENTISNDSSSTPKDNDSQKIKSKDNIKTPKSKKNLKSSQKCSNTEIKDTTENKLINFEEEEYLDSDDEYLKQKLQLLHDFENCPEEEELSTEQYKKALKEIGIMDFDD